MKRAKKICLIVALVISMIYHGMIAHNMAERFFCYQMLKAIENDNIALLRINLLFGDPDSITMNPIIDLISDVILKTPLQAACCEGNIDMVKLLVEKGADVNYTTRSCGCSPLWWAAESESPNNLEIVRYLLKNGADVDNAGKRAASSIITHVFNQPPSQPNHMEILRELINATEDSTKKYYLKSACYWKHEEEIRFLVEEYGFDVSDPYYLCAYCSGYDRYSRETFEYFLKHGADPYAKDERGKCAIDYLKEEAAPEWAETVAEMAKEYGFEG